MRVKIAVMRRIDNRILTGATDNVLHRQPIEDTPLNALYALVFILSSFAVPAQALDASIIDLDDYFGEITEPSAVPAQMVATEPTIEKPGEAVDGADGVASSPPRDAADTRVGAIQPSDEAPSVEYATRSDDKLAVEDTTEPSTMPAQIVATESTIREPGEALDEADVVATSPPSDAADTPVGAIAPSGNESEELQGG